MNHVTPTFWSSGSPEWNDGVAARSAHKMKVQAYARRDALAMVLECFESP